MKPGEASHYAPRLFAIPNLPDALCQETDPELFFPEKGGTTTAAKKICNRCGEQDNCLQWAIDHDERFGVWGGKGPSELKRLRKKRAAA